MVFQITLQQMIILFLFMAVGFFMMKKKMLPENAAAVLSKLLVTAFLPCMVFKTFATNLNPENVLSKLPLFLISAVNVTLSCLIAMLIAMIIGIIFGVCSIPVPEVVLNAATSASNCMAPCAMLLTGFVLAKQPLGAMFTQAKSYFISALKLIVFPAVGFFLMRLLGAPEQAVILCTIALALPFGLNSVVFPEAFGGDSTPGARLCFIGNLMALITIPVVFYLLSMAYGI